MNSAPNPIKDYYIAYFDILGYREYFSTHSETVVQFLNMIHNAIQNTKVYINTINQSLISGRYGNIEINVRIFSDNFLLCMEVTDATLEPVRLMAFLQMVAEIQRGFVNGYGLFVRGGICKGKISFNDDYIFGQGLIDAVAMEEKEAKYPRIIIAKELAEEVQKHSFYTQEEIDRRREINQRFQLNEELTTEDQVFCNQMQMRGQLCYLIQLIFQQWVLLWPDDCLILNYLTKANIIDYMNPELLQFLKQQVKQISPSDFELISQPTADINQILQRHKSQVEEQLKKYGSNADINTDDIARAEGREKILRKYIWVMAFHNCACDLNQKPEYKILTKCNCDARFLKMTINVLDEDASK